MNYNLYTTCDNHVISDTTTVRGIQTSHLCQSAFCIWQKIHPTGLCVCGEGEEGGSREREEEGRGKKSNMQSVEQ